MLKELLLSYADYTLWANKRICELIINLPNNIIDTPVESSFPTIRKTIYHIWDAQVIWYNRLNGISLSSWPSEEYSENFPGFEIYFLQQTDQFVQFIWLKQENFFEQPIRYTSLSGKEYEDKAGQIILHCMNHSTYHRGQIITLLHTFGITQLPQTDYILYLRTKENNNTFRL